MDGPRTTALPVALALLLVLSPIAAVVHTGAGASTAARPASDAGPSPSSDAPGARMTDAPGAGFPPVTGGRNTTAYLAIEASDVQRSGRGTVSLDVAGAAALDRAALEGRHSYLSLVESFTDAGTTAEREVAVERAIARLTDRVAALERRERAALAAFNEGDMSARAYLRELAVVNARADGLSRSLTQLYEYVDSMRESPVSPARIAELKSRLVGLRGPVRDRVAGAMRGGDDPVRVFVETSETAVVLATVTGSEFNRQYVREAYLPGVRDPGGTDRFRTDRGYDLEAARTRASELYPWTFENAGPTSTGLRTGEPYLYRAGVYSVTVDHPHGTAGQGDLVTYIDGATGDVFREVQFKDVSEVPTAEPLANRSDGLYLAVNRTHPGGPVSVRVRSNATGDPVDATVSVDGEPVGRTGSDGRFWTVASREAFTVTATAGDRNVTVGPMLPADTL
ncbi:hypothetical protein BRC93_12785 [Halobacteriales archaeon QS_5_70_15]|nr:MAG: hypothetical protein BRC93_12785 [Halobacteriales archaeon QS_5_70_15]